MVATLPPGSEAACEDVKEAYRSIPIRTEDWLALVVRIGEDQFCPDTCLCFGARPGDGLHGEVADTFLDIARATGLGPVLPWVDDNVWFRVLRCYLPEYNRLRAEAQERIRQCGGERTKGARRWWDGGATASGRMEEFTEDLQFPIRDLSAGPNHRSDHDERFSYALCDVERIAGELGVEYSLEKRQEFGPWVEFTGLDWGIQDKDVGLPERKQKKYLLAIEQILATGAKPSLKEVESVVGKLGYASLVVPEGRAYLASLL
jgi:hypothetical protein